MESMKTRQAPRATRPRSMRRCQWMPWSQWGQELLAIVVLVSLLGISAGCRLCCNPDDTAYGAYGGKWQRTSRTTGRVGSLVDPGGAAVVNRADRDSAPKSAGSAANSQSDLGEESDEREPDSSMPRKSEEESEREFQERKRQLEEEENLLNAQVIPGRPSPPKF